LQKDNLNTCACASFSSVAGHLRILCATSQIAQGGSWTKIIWPWSPYRRV